jgi:hypothetical protein
MKAGVFLNENDVTVLRTVGALLRDVWGRDMVKLN